MALVHCGQLVSPDFQGGSVVAPLASPEHPPENQEDANGHHEGCCRGEDDDQQAFPAHVVVSSMLGTRHGWTCTQVVRERNKRNWSLVNHYIKVECSSGAGVD